MQNCELECIKTTIGYDYFSLLSLQDFVSCSSYAPFFFKTLPPWNRSSQHNPFCLMDGVWCYEPDTILHVSVWRFSACSPHLCLGGTRGIQVEEKFQSSYAEGLMNHTNPKQYLEAD